MAKLILTQSDDDFRKTALAIANLTTLARWGAIAIAAVFVLTASAAADLEVFDEMSIRKQ